MNMLSLLYMANATLLLLHEIESAYEREWEILKLPGQITGFLLMHIPIIFLVLYGLVEIDKISTVGIIFGIIMGISGLMPFLVHKIIVKTVDHFNLMISDVIIYLNVLSGVGLLLMSLRRLTNGF
ncbi:MAG: hypothetical protein P8165_15195 [Deltaproteobacteria bacterium]|jgi:hypothetical protein